MSTRRAERTLRASAADPAVRTSNSSFRRAWTVGSTCGSSSTTSKEQRAWLTINPIASLLRTCKYIASGHQYAILRRRLRLGAQSRKRRWKIGRLRRLFRPRRVPARELGQRDAFHELLLDMRKSHVTMKRSLPNESKRPGSGILSRTRAERLTKDWRPVAYGLSCRHFPGSESRRGYAGPKPTLNWKDG